MSDFFNDVADAIPGNVVGAIILLVVGWIVARFLGSVTARGLRRTGIDDRVNRWMGRSDSGTDAADVGGKLVYFGVLIFVLVAVFDLLDMPLMTEPLTDMLSGFMAFIPRLIAAAILALLAWVLATIVRTVVVGIAQGVNLDGRVRRMQGAAEAGEPTIARALGEIGFALVLLFFLPAILSVLEMQGILEPVQQLFNEFFAFLPNLIAAVLIIGIGWWVARFVGNLVRNLIAAVGADSFGERIGVSRAVGDQGLSGIIGLFVYILILVPVLIAGLDALELDSITAPASNMLNSLLAFIPMAIGALAIVAIAFAIGRVVSNLVAELLRGTWYDALPQRVAGGFAGETGTEGGIRFSLADLTGQAILAVILWFATIAALDTLGLDSISALLVDLLGIAGHILLGLIIFVVGLLLARLAGRLVRGTDIDNAGLASVAAQAAVLVLFGAMALRQMGVANDIINLAFGIMLGAIGIAVAVAFGVGGRDVAGRQLEQWVASAEEGGGASDGTP